MVISQIESDISTETTRDNDICILVICDHRMLGKAIEAALKPLATVEILYHSEENPVTATTAARIHQAPLVILSLLHCAERQTGPTHRDLLRTVGWTGSPPVLIISEEPEMPALGHSATHYLRFPFEVETLRHHVGELLLSIDGPTSAHGQANSRPGALVVEDESIVAADLQRTLERLGYNVLGKVARAEAAIAFIRENPCDVILMDIHLDGEMDGITATDTIQSETDIPVVFLTAHSDTATLERAQQTAPYGYVLKPYDDRELDSALRVALYRAEAERTIRERERWLHAILRSTGDGVIATDAGGRVIFINPVAQTLLHTKWDRALHRPLSDVFTATATESNTTQTEKNLTTAQRETVRLTHNGKHQVIDQTRSPIYDERGEFCGEIRALRDVTQQEHSRRMLQQQTEELAEQNKELTAFAHTVAHDIKDPLHVIRGYAELLVSDELPLDESIQAQGLQTIVDYSKRITNIVDELLLLSTVRDSEVYFEPLVMESILAHAEERLTYLKSRKGAIIRRAIETWPIAIGHPSWIEEVWVNYLSNGMKYGGEPPMLEVGASLENGMVRCWVRDNGPGIQPEDIDRLFVPFSQLHQVRATGQGLGLSIVRRIISRLGGEVGVESKPGQGSTFYFILPAAELSPGQTAHIP